MNTWLSVVQYAGFASFLAAASLASNPPHGDEDHASDWTSLDRELDQLSKTVEPEGSALKIGGYFKFNVVRAPDVQDAFGDTKTAFELNGVWLDISGKLENGFGYYIGISGYNSKGQTVLRDATITVPIVSGIHATVGQCKPKFLYSATVSRSKGLFLERAKQGSIWTRRDVGVIFTGHEGRCRWDAGVQNGGDTTAERNLYEGKFAFDAVGKGIDPKQEGGYGVDAPSRLTVAISAVDDDSVTGGSVGAAELEGVYDRFFVAGEVLKYGSGWVKKAASGGAAKGANGLAGETPYDFEVACALSHKFEVAVRYQNQNDINATRDLTYGLNWYVHGHACKWQLNWVHTDNIVQHLDVYELGLTLAF